MSDAEIRLECVRLALIYNSGPDVIAHAAGMARFVLDGELGLRKERPPASPVASKYPRANAVAL